MASDPAFAATVKTASGLVPATLDTVMTAPTNVTTIVTAGSSGSKIEQIRCQGIATTVAGIVNIFLYDGATYHLFDQFLVTAVTSSATAVAYQATNTYSNLWIPTGWSLRVTNTIAGNQAIIKVTVTYGDF